MEVESSEKDRPCLTKMTTPPLACVVSEERMPDRSGCDQNTEQRIQEFEKKKEVKIGFLNADMVDRMGRKKVK